MNDAMRSRLGTGALVAGFALTLLGLVGRATGAIDGSLPAVVAAVALVFLVVGVGLRRAGA